MDVFEKDQILKSFQIVVDTREHRTPKLFERCKAFNASWERRTLDYGDYAALITIEGKELYSNCEKISPCTVIERKESLDELAMCLTRGRDRFRREFERARDAGARVYLLVENGSWEAIINHRYRSQLNSKAFLASLMAWSIRYRFTPLFCRSETSGKLIKEILYRDMKERLEGGEYG